MRTEVSVLKLSLAAILAFAVLGITFGLISGSFAIVFDGVFSLIDAVTSVISITVATLIARSAVERNLPQRIHRRFTDGFWHFEPIVLATASLIMITVAFYALVTSVQALLSGGREVQFGPAVTYAGIVVTLSAVVAVLEYRANRSIKSAMISLDIKGWVMAAGVTGALLIAFLLGYLVQGTSVEWLTPYIDPGVLAVIALVLIPVPLPDLIRSVKEIARVTPPELLAEVEAVARETAAIHGFRGHELYASRQGRSRQLEIEFSVPAQGARRHLREWDAIRANLRGRLIGDDPHGWLIVTFTTEPRGDQSGGGDEPPSPQVAARSASSHRVRLTPRLGSVPPRRLRAAGPTRRTTPRSPR